MIRSSITPLALFIVTASLLAQSPSEDAPRIQSHLRQAQQDLQNKRTDLAISEFKAILAIDASNLDARANLGVLEYFDSQYSNAAQDLRSALQINPAVSKLQALLGMSEKRIGENAKAQVDLEKAFPQLQEQKLRVETGLELIEVDYALNDRAKAAEVVNVLRELEPANVDVLYAAYRIYSELSEETMLSLAMLAPDSARMHQLMAHELAREAKDDTAIANYRIALKLDPQRADVHYELAEMLNTQSSPAARVEAEKEYKAALALNPFDEKSQSRLGDIALRRADLKGALACYSRALKMQPDDPDANLGVAKVLISMHQPQEAEPHLERAAQLDPTNPATHYRLAALYRELNRPVDAHRELAEFEKLKKMKSKLSDLYQQMRLQPGKREEPQSDLPE